MTSKRIITYFFSKFTCNFFLESLIFILLCPVFNALIGDNKSQINITLRKMAIFGLIRSGTKDSVLIPRPPDSVLRCSINESKRLWGELCHNKTFVVNLKLRCSVTL